MKQGLRQSIIAARQNMTAAERAEFSRAISARILQLDAYRDATSVLAYMSFGAEFDTRAWLEQAMRDNKQILLPRVNKDTKQLDLYRITDLQRDVAPGTWNIPEPLEVRCTRVDAPERPDFILLPGVAFTRDGSRLGYGGGFYDKLLARIKPLRGTDGVPAVKPVLAAAAFSLQLLKDIPMEPTDRKVEWLLTENEVIHCAAG